MKRRGATLNHPIPPLACTAKKDCIFRLSRTNKAILAGLRDPICEQPPTLTFAAVLSFHDGSSNRFRPDRDLSNPLPRLESGKVFAREDHGYGRDQALDKTRSFPKSNRMTHPPHSVKVETQVMQGI